MKQLGYVVIKNGAYQQTFNYPHILDRARAMGDEYAARLAATDTQDAYGRPSVVTIVETFQSPAPGGGLNITGETVAKWVGIERVL